MTYDNVFEQIAAAKEFAYLPPGNASAQDQHQGITVLACAVANGYELRAQSLSFVSASSGATQA